MDLQETYLVFGLFERAVDIILGLPDSRNTLLVVPETLFEVVPEFTEERLFCCLFVDFRP